MKTEFLNVYEENEKITFIDKTIFLVDLNENNEDENYYKAS